MKPVPRFRLDPVMLPALAEDGMQARACLPGTPGANSKRSRDATHSNSVMSCSRPVLVLAHRLMPSAFCG